MADIVSGGADCGVDGGKGTDIEIGRAVTLRLSPDPVRVFGLSRTKLRPLSAGRIPQTTTLPPPSAAGAKSSPSQGGELRETGLKRLRRPRRADLTQLRVQGLPASPVLSATSRGSNREELAGRPAARPRQTGVVPWACCITPTGPKSFPKMQRRSSQSSATYPLDQGRARYNRVLGVHCWDWWILCLNFRSCPAAYHRAAQDRDIPLIFGFGGFRHPGKGPSWAGTELSGHEGAIPERNGEKRIGRMEVGRLNIPRRQMEKGFYSVTVQGMWSRRLSERSPYNIVSKCTPSAG